MLKFPNAAHSDFRIQHSVFRIHFPAEFHLTV
ncbi:MAG: hypothetical protein FD138_1758 [Planctomycetota bacterium]|nr:MAG: hypothetical protein FD138_1758 [Planctomycetota bacterium]